MNLNRDAFYMFFKELMRFNKTYSVLEEKGVVYCASDMGFNFAYSSSYINYVP